MTITIQTPRENETLLVIGAKVVLRVRTALGTLLLPGGSVWNRTIDTWEARPELRPLVEAWLAEEVAKEAAGRVEREKEQAEREAWRETVFARPSVPVWGAVGEGYDPDAATRLEDASTSLLEQARAQGQSFEHGDILLEGVGAILLERNGSYYPATEDEGLLDAARAWVSARRMRLHAENLRYVGPALSLFEIRNLGYTLETTEGMGTLRKGVKILAKLQFQSGLLVSTEWSCSGEEQREATRVIKGYQAMAQEAEDERTGWKAYRDRFLVPPPHNEDGQ